MKKLIFKIGVKKFAFILGMLLLMVGSILDLTFNPIALIVGLTWQVFGVIAILVSLMTPEKATQRN